MTTLLSASGGGALVGDDIRKAASAESCGGEGAESCGGDSAVLLLEALDALEEDVEAALDLES